MTIRVKFIVILFVFLSIFLIQGVSADDAANLTDAGVALFDEGKYEEALQMGFSAKAINNQFAPAWNLISDSLLHLKRYQAALDAADTALQLNPTYTKASINKALAQNYLKRYQGSIDTCDNILSRDRNNIDAFEIKGINYYYLLRKDQALQEFKRINEIDPNYSAAWGREGVIYYEMGKYEEAVFATGKALELDPKNELASEYYNLSNQRLNVQKSSYYFLLTTLLCVLIFLLVLGYAISRNSQIILNNYQVIQKVLGVNGQKQVINSSNFTEKLKPYEYGFRYSSIFHAVIFLDIIGGLLSFSVMKEILGANSFIGIFFAMIFLINCCLIALLLLNEKRSPDRVDIRLVWMKGLFGFVGITTIISGFYFTLQCLFFYKYQKQILSTQKTLYNPIICQNCFTKYANREIVYCNHCGVKIVNQKTPEEIKNEQECARQKNIQAELLSLSNNSHQYIENYALKHASSRKGSDEFNNLKDLLVKNGHNYEDDHLQEIVDAVILNQKIESFRQKILHNNPKTPDDCIRNFLELFGNNYCDYTDIILKILNDKFDYRGNIVTDIQRINRDIEIERFESHLVSDSQNIKKLTIRDIDQMSGYNFESFLKRIFEKMGYKVQHTTLSNDQGADLIVEKFGERTVIQAKNWGNNVGNSGIQEVVAAIKHYNATKAMVISTSGFTAPAIDLAKSNNVELWDRSKLVKILEEYQ